MYPVKSPAISSANSVRLKFNLNFGAMLPAFLAMLAVQTFRADHHGWPAAIWAETALMMLLPIGMYWYFSRWFGNNDEQMKSTSALYIAQAGAFTLAVVGFAWHMVSRSIGMGDSNEVTLLAILQNVCWYIAVFSVVRGFERASLILSGALVFFTCCMTESTAVFVISGAFAIVCLWWLLGHYWSRLDSKAIDGNSQMLPVHGSSIGIATIIIGSVVGLALLAPINESPLATDGFMPFSGGDNGYEDEFARSGIGDGNMLTAGANATTSGAVDSDQFIQDDKPSIYDVMTERYDGPGYKKPPHRAVALDVIAKHLHDIKQSEQSGRTFRTMRDSENADIDYESKITKALLFIEGSVPVRFTIDAFNHFDGWDWSKEPIPETTALQPPIKLAKRRGKPIYQLSQFITDYLAGRRAHRVKIMRLDSATLPSPTFLKDWHIARVEQQGLFEWNDVGLIRLKGRTIPSHTVIDVQSHVPNYHIMRNINDLRRRQQISSIQHKVDEFLGAASKGGAPASHSIPIKKGESDSPFLQTPETGAKQTLKELVSEWTEGIEPGWNQVESIVQNLRREYELNPDWEKDESTEDTVGHFLEQGGGPSYMFATTCSMALRIAGYKTRLAEGFLIRKKDYDRKARQSIVTSANLHMWPEVCLDGRFWIPVEPTPGYPVPYSTQTAWQWLTAKANAAMLWIFHNPVTAIFVTVVSCLLFYFRIELVTLLMLCWWFLIRLFWPRGLLKTTRQLIDVRFWAAGDRRPASETIRTWYTRVEPGLSTGFFDLWNAKNYCDSPSSVSGAELLVNCRQTMDSLTQKKIREFLSSKRQEDDHDSRGRPGY